jgi:hypothetical protein
MASLWDAAPTILSFLGGPAGGLVGAGVEFLADKLGATDKTKEGIQAALSNADPLELKKLDYDFQKFCLSNGIQVQLAQIAVNAEEAKSASILVSGWRPLVGWIGAIALGYAAILEPIARFVANVLYNYQGPFPVIDTNITMQVLFGILGLGAYRTVERVKGVARQ